ncbi:diacylglycerol/lipid kinase family protein [Leifsonia sp. NPDC014704]|uniref:diacylglycerol/lipid kinase family protein n=1 Tax=Leifsonia sp. NPDC014704 TaxID=3364123 RepID=UPI0036F49FA1
MAVVYNPVNVPADVLRSAVAAAEAEHGWASTLWYETGREDSGTAAAQAAIVASPDVILAAGGDGTVRAVAEEIQRTRIPLALLPSGTGNLLARNLHLTLDDLPRAVETAFTGTERLVDIATASYRTPDGALQQRAFVVMAGIGLDAHMASNTNSTLKKRIGWVAYADPIARSVLKGKRIHFRYRIDGARAHTLNAHTVIVGNCGTITANVLLLPDAVVDDGLLDVVVFQPRGPAGWAGIGSRLATNSLFARSRPGRWLMRKAPDLKALDYVQAGRFDARFDAPQELELDGDPVGVVIAITLTVQHRGLALRVPR